MTDPSHHDTDADMADGEESKSQAAEQPEDVVLETNLDQHNQQRADEEMEQRMPRAILRESAEPTRASIVRVLRLTSSCLVSCWCVRPVEDLHLPFETAFAQWYAQLSKKAILPDAKYAAILIVLQNGIVSSPRWKEWNSRYRLRLLPPNTQPFLYVEGDALIKRKPGGRHKQNGRVTLEEILANNNIAPPTQPDEEMNSNAAGSAAAASPASMSIPKQGRAYPNEPHPVLKQVVRYSEVESILQRIHSQGHIGIDSTFEMIGRYYHGIPRDVVAGWIKRCQDCKTRTRPIAPPSRILQAIPTHRYLDHIQADCFFFVDRRGITQHVRTVLHIVCLATKWCELVVVPDKSGPTMRLLFWRVFARIGPPKIFQTDNGSEFVNPEVTQLINQVGAEARHGSPYKPSTQGAVERKNDVAKKALHMMCKDPTYSSWEFADLLAQCQYWLNSYPSRVTKQSAYFLVYGRVPPLMADSGPYHSAIDTFEGEDQEYGEDEEAQEILRNHEDRQQAAAANTAIYQSQWMQQVNGGQIDETFQVGQLVLLTVVSKRKHKSLARTIDKQRVLILRALPYSKYLIYTIHGLLKDPVHANELTQNPNAISPLELQLSAEQVQELLDLYDSKQAKGMTIDNFIEKLVQVPLVPVAARVEYVQPTIGQQVDAEPKMVLRITRKRKDQP